MIEAALNTLVRGSGSELTAYLNEVDINLAVPNTKTVSHFYHVHLDGNGRDRVNDFIEFIARKIVEYSIPRSEFEKAKDFLNNHNSDSELARLRKKAETLFTDLKNTGEGGEILLYILAQEYLKLPQILCKMPLKTNTQMHYHGVDGIHGEFDKTSGTLALYWGESKLYKDVEAAITACFGSLKEYLLNSNGSTSPQERDLQLVKDGLDLGDQKLEEAIVNYFDKDHPNFNKLQYRGVCLVGFDSDKYPKNPNQMVSADLQKTIKNEVTSWSKSLEKGIGSHLNLDSFIIHIFLIPFPSVDEFRDAFLRAINITPRPTKKTSKVAKSPSGTKAPVKKAVAKKGNKKP